MQASGMHAHTYKYIYIISCFIYPINPSGMVGVDKRIKAYPSNEGDSYRWV